MLDFTGLSEPFTAFFTASGVGKTGLTVVCDVYAPGGTALVTGAAATEIGGGYYDYTLASGSTGTAGLYRAVFRTTDTTVDSKQVPSVWILGKAWVASHPSAVPNAAGGVPTVGTGTGQVNPASGKVPATLAASDVTGNLAADLQTIKTQAITCAAGVTVLASVGTATTSTAQTGDNFARLGAPTGASIAADIQTRSTYAGAAPDNTSILAIKAATDKLAFAGSGPYTVNANVATGSGVVLATSQPNYAPAKAGDAMTLDLTQAIPMTKAKTTGGAFAAAWLTGFGGAFRDATNRALKLFGLGASSSPSAPDATFSLDDPTNPTTRTLQ